MAREVRLSGSASDHAVETSLATPSLFSEVVSASVQADLKDTTLSLELPEWESTTDFKESLDRVRPQ